jgi:hypothetical protein
VIETLVFFFQNYATRRKKKNTIKGLVDDNGVLQEDGEVMGNIIQGYFQNLFSSEVGDLDPSVIAEV